MDIQAFYREVGGDYQEVFSRLMKDERILKFVKRFPAGEDYTLAQEALKDGRWEELFRYSHNLKGVGLNLGLGDLANAASELCETCRHGAPAVPPLAEMEKVKEAYERTCAAIAQLE